MNKRGFTILEVVISFMIISLMAVCILGSTTNQLALTGKTKNITEVAYSEQEEMEKGIRTLEDLIKEKHELEKIINTNPENDPAAVDAKKRWKGVNASLEAYKGMEYTIFNKRVKAYKLDTSKQGEKPLLMTWVTDRERKEYPTPIVKDFKVYIKDEKDKLFSIFARDKSGISEVSYENKNKELLFTELYQWYVSREGFNIPLESDIKLKDIPEADIGTKYPSFPGDFEIITTEKSRNLSKVKPEYEGKFLICTITPATRQGKMGAMKASNLLYISQLPKLNRNYQMVIDASLLPREQGNNKISKIKSVTGNSKLQAVLTSEKKLPILNPIETITGSIKNKGLDAKLNIYSRCIAFDYSNAMRIQDTYIPESFSLFIVAKLETATGNKNILSSTSRYDFENGNRDGILRAGLDGVSVEQYDNMGELKSTVLMNNSNVNGKWHVISISVGNDISYKIDGNSTQKKKLPVDFSTNNIQLQLGNDFDMQPSNTKLEFAEFIIYGDDDQQSFDKIHQYLLKKYGTEENK